MTHKIKIATDFSENPKGRYASHGPWNGTAFRENILMPLVVTNLPINIDLEGLTGFRPSFFEEAFGGLYRSPALSKSQKKTLKEQIIFLPLTDKFQMAMWERVHREILRTQKRFWSELNEQA